MHQTKRLYLFVGYPGSGKTTIARIIAETTGAVNLWADHERQVMFGRPAHTPEESRQLYGYLNDKAASLLENNQSVIFDTNFNFRQDRDLLRKIAASHQAEIVLIWVTTDIELARKRATKLSEGKDTRIWGNMTLEDFDRMSSSLEIPEPDEQAICFDGTHVDPADVINRLQLKP